MTFLNPLVLFGMIAAAIPVILHLLNLRKLRTIEFSTLRFLKELQQTKIRKLKIRQLLLLIIRTLLVLFIVLAFARPAFRGTILGKIGGNAHSSVVFIFDDSFSMNASDERGELLKQAKETAGRLVDLLNEGDEAFFIKLSDLPEATIGQGSHDFRTLKKFISDIQVSSISRPLDGALQLSAKLLTQSRNANKEIYIISDMQQSLFNERITQRQTGALFDTNVKFFLATLGSETQSNVCVDSVEVKTQIIEKEKPVNIYSSIRNYSGNTIQNYVVSVFLEGVRVAQNSVRLEPWSSAALTFTVTPKKSGFIKGYVEIEHDAVDEDNRRNFTVYVPEKISLGIVTNSQTDTKLPLIAMHSGEQDINQSLFNIRQVTPKDFQFLGLDTMDVLMVSFPGGLNTSNIDKIKGFVQNGGGLILFPTSDYQNDEVSRSLINTLSISPVEGVTGSSQSQSSLSFKEVDLEHPVFATVFEKNQPNQRNTRDKVESPTILKSLRRGISKEAHSIITLSDGSPFLSEHKFGNGKILFFSVAPTLLWSDFPVKGLFAPLVYRSAVYASSVGKEHYTYITGDSPTLTLPNVPLALRTGSYKLVSPDGMEELITETDTKNIKSTDVKHAGASLTVNLKRLSQPGFYQFLNKTELLTSIAVNTDKNESDERKVSSDQLETFWKKFGIEPASITMLDEPEQVQKTITESRFGVELWKHCLTIALLLALLEMYLARDSRKEMQQMMGQVAT